jgi:hypothetical protein
VDPADVIMALYHAAFPVCDHPRSNYGELDKVQYTEFTFDRVLGGWNKDHIATQNGSSSDGPRKRNITVILDSALKYNVALSLAYPGTVVYGGQCCAQCAVTVLNRDGRLPSSIIRTASNLGPKLVAGPASPQ